MTRIANWPTRAMYIVVALALVLGMGIVPAIPATAQAVLVLPFITVPEDPVAYNVKGATHKVCIDLGDYQIADIDWFVETGPAGTIGPDDVTVLSPTGPNPWSGNVSYGETVKTIGTIDNVTCIEIRANMQGDILIRARVIDARLPDGVMTLSTEKKWGEILRSDLDVDAKTDGVQHTMPTVEIPAAATGIYKQTIIDTITADFLLIPAPVLVDGAVVHWWLLEDKPEHKDKIRELMQYLAAYDPDDPGSFYEPYTASGKYKTLDPEMEGKQPWEWINDWVTDAAAPKYADPDIFEWGTLDPCGTIDFVPGTGNWYAWNESDGGKATATIWVDIDEMEVCKTYKIMIVVLVSYPGGTTDQEDPFNGENRVAVQIGQKSYHKARTPLTDQVKTPQLRWASEKIVLEKDWGVEPKFEWGHYWYNTDTTKEHTQVCEGVGGCAPVSPNLNEPWEHVGHYFDAQIYISIYNLELGSIGNLEPINDLYYLTVDTGTWGTVEIDIDSLGLPAGHGQVIAPLGGRYYSRSEVGYPLVDEMWGDSISRCILSTEQSGQADVNAALYEIGLLVEEIWGMGRSETIMWVEGPIVNHGFLAYFLNLEDVTLSDETPPSSLQDLVPEADDAHVAVQVRGYFDYRHSHLPPTTREAKPVDWDGDGVDDTFLPAGRYVLPDDWWLLAGTRNVSLRPNFDLMDQADRDTIFSDHPLGPYGDVPTWQKKTSYSVGDFVRPTKYNGHMYECAAAGTSGDTEPTWPMVNEANVTDDTVLWTCRAGVATTDPPGEAEFPTIGPFSTLQQWSVEGKWVAANTVPTSYLGLVRGRNTVVPDGNIDRWDAPMPPALVIFDIVYETEDASLSQLRKTNLEGYGYTGDAPRTFHSPYYEVEIPASPYIPPGYLWQSWTAWGVLGWTSVDGPYPFWTDLEMETRWLREDPTDLDHKDVEVYSDNHGIAAVAIDALADVGYVTIMATADFPYTPKMGKYGPRVSGGITAAWGEPPLPEPTVRLVADETEVEVGQTVTFTNESFGGEQPYLAALWQFGDGVTSNLAIQPGETVTHHYTTPGLYTVTLSITDGNGITHHYTKDDYITVAGENGGLPPTITWNCPLGGQALIAPNAFAGRPELTAPVSCADITVSAGAELWGIYYLVETGPDAGTWLWYVPGFGTSTLTQLEPGPRYFVVVSAPCTLTLPPQ